MLKVHLPYITNGLSSNHAFLCFGLFLEPDGQSSNNLYPRRKQFCFTKQNAKYFNDEVHGDPCYGLPSRPPCPLLWTAISSMLSPAMEAGSLPPRTTVTLYWILSYGTGVEGLTVTYAPIIHITHMKLLLNTHSLFYHKTILPIWLKNSGWTGQMCKSQYQWPNTLHVKGSYPTLLARHPQAGRAAFTPSL